MPKMRLRGVRRALAEFSGLVADFGSHVARRIARPPTNLKRLSGEQRAHKRRNEGTRDGYTPRGTPRKVLKDMTIQGRIRANGKRLIRWYHAQNTDSTLPGDDQ